MVPRRVHYRIPARTVPQLVLHSLLAMSTVLENTAPFKTVLGHALVKDEHGKDMHKSAGNSIPFHEAADHMGVDVMRWMYTAHNPEHNLLFGYGPADEIRKKLLTLWNMYSFLYHLR